MSFYGLARPLLFSMDPERAHHLVLQGSAFAARHRWITQLTRSVCAPKTSPFMAMDAFGLRFPSPIGLAAGLDKNGDAIDLWAALGFGFVEVGTVTPDEGQPGNPPPRLERLVEDQALVNRMGFNNLGAPQLARHLKARRTAIPVGANVGKAKVTPLEGAADDYEKCIAAVFPHADYVVLNVSSPNTPGLRDLQAIGSLRPLLSRAMSCNQSLAEQHGRSPRPILLKISPDLADDDVDAVADLALETGLSGLIATNTTLSRDGLSRAPKIEGGLSGAPLKSRALSLTRRLYRRLENKIPIVGVGGVGSADDAWERIRAGATLIQIYTALVYQGPVLVAKIAAGLEDRARKAGYDSLARAVGAGI